MKRSMILTVILATVAGVLGSGVARADASLTMKAVDEVVAQSDRAVQACGRGSLRRGETVAVMVLLTIDADGHVADAFAPTHTSTSTCLEKVARRMHFPATGDTTQIDFPFLVAARR